jgi:ADP-heptose:LPS heptosyltransferase
MASDDLATLQRIKRTLRPARRRYEYERKVFLMACFRHGVNALRILHVFPMPTTPGAPGPDLRTRASATALRILIVNLTPHLGDAIMLMPLIEALRKANPQARIEFAVEQGGAPLLQQMSELDHVYALSLGSAPPITFWMSVHRALSVTREYWRHMRHATPTICLLPRWGDDLFRSAALAYLTGAPQRIGFSWDVASHATPASYRDKLLTQAIHSGSGLHDPQRFCLPAIEAGLLSNADITSIGQQAIPALQHIAATIDWPTLQHRLGLPNQPFAIIAPGASMARRMWPLDRWTQIFEALEARGFHVILLAGKSDASVAQDLWQRTGKRATLVAGATTLVESVALIAHATLFLGSDSGPGHVAGALGISSIILFVAVLGADPDGPSSPERVHPTGPNVLCITPPHTLPPCEGSCLADAPHCITLIEPQAVLQAIDAAMGVTTHA